MERLEKQFKIDCINYTINLLENEYLSDGSFSILDDRLIDYQINNDLVSEEDVNMDDYMDQPLGYDIVKNILLNELKKIEGKNG